jgi:hypothetical protein
LRPATLIVASPIWPICDRNKPFACHHFYVSAAFDSRGIPEYLLPELLKSAAAEL